MFKPLLRTLPTLSGNFTIACKLREFDKESTNEYSTYVRLANLIPLQNYMNNRNIEINLLNGKYEHDIKKYYYYYSNVFYKSNYSYSKNNYNILDLESIYNYNNDVRNKDYEFGCKRMQYSQIGSQFNFYAPIYIDNVNDLPEYFKICIDINSKVKKEIKIYINKDNKRNYLKTYLSHYLKKIDERVIFCLNDSYQATYFGIDVKNGGLNEYKDNVIGFLYKNQTTINNFDYTICKGFERNSLIMRQIIPLSFSFNLSDIFNNYESSFFEGAKLKISGYYYSKHNYLYDTYDFDINYIHSYNKFNHYNEYSGRYEFINGKDSDNNDINIMDVGFPALHESKYTKYLYTNKITPMYCKFKLLYSSDEDPYITNLNYAYSFNQYPNEKYGYFPTMFKGIFPKAIIENNDFKLPIGVSLDNYYKVQEYYGNTIRSNTTNIDKYNKLMSNYFSSWYNISEYFKISTLEDDSLWSDVKYDYTYFKGILYSFKNLQKYNIQKFGVFCNVNIKCVEENELNNNYLKANIVLSSKDNNGNSTFNYNDSINMEYNYTIDNSVIQNIILHKKIYDIPYNKPISSQVKHNKTMIEDIHGTYIEEPNYIDENTYYKLLDVYNLLKNILYINEDYKTYFKNIEIPGYELVNANNNINFYEYVNNTLQFILTGKCYGINNISSKYKWLVNSLYYSNQTNKEKSLVKDIYNTINYNENIYGKLCFFIQNMFVHKNDIYDLIISLYKELYNYEYSNDNDFIRIKDIIISMFNKLKNMNNINSVFNNIDIYNININNIFDSVCETTLVNDKQIKLKNSKLREQFNKSILKGILDNVLINLIKKYNILSQDEKSKFDPYANIERNDIIDNNIINLLSKLNNIQKYQYNINGNINGIEIEDYFNTTDKVYKDIYVDTYNLNDFVNQYNRKESDNIDINNFTQQTFYIKIINKTHLIEYCKKLSNEIYNTDISRDIQHLNLLDRIFVKQRYWLIDENIMYPVDKYVTLFTVINDKLNSIKEKIIDDSKIKLINNKISYLNYLHNASDYEIINFLNGKTVDNKNNVLSNERNSTTNCFVFNFGQNPYDESSDIILSLDLCINKNVIKLNNQLRKILDKQYFLYLYICDDCLMENISPWNTIDLSTYNQFKKSYKDINSYLIPLFNNVYYNSLDNATIQKMLENNKINNKNQYVVAYDKYFKEINVDNIILSNFIKYDDYVNQTKYVNPIEFIFNSFGITNYDLINEWELYCESNNIYITDINTSEQYTTYINKLLAYIKNYDNDTYYEIIKYSGIKLYSIKENIIISYNTIEIDEKDKELYKTLIYDNNSNMYIYTYTDNKGNKTNYAFYWITLNIDNTNNTFNIDNDYNFNIVFNTIDSLPITNTYMNSIFYLLEPFLKINVFNEFTKNVKNIIYPSENEVEITYVASTLNLDEEKIKYNILKDNADDILYNEIIQLNKSRKIKLLRYFNFITPYIKKTNVINDCFELKCIDKDNIYKNVKKYNIFTKENINIYKYNGIKLYDGVYSNIYESFVNNGIIDSPTIIYQYEYKHFNDNLLYNLPINLSLNDSKLYTYNEIQELEDNNELIQNQKIKILSQYFNKKELISNNIILFLFNKYTSNMIIEPVKTHTSKYDNLYKITYKFTLN